MPKVDFSSETVLFNFLFAVFSVFLGLNMPGGGGAEAPTLEKFAKIRAFCRAAPLDFFFPYAYDYSSHIEGESCNLLPVTCSKAS